jgi:AhpD family alkylhydroperoxidase
MEMRINLMERGQKIIKALNGLNLYLGKSSLEKQLCHLIDFRVSQINGCAYCLDMHSKDLRAGGESEQRLYMLIAWRESGPLYSERERAALEWAEAVTKLTDGNVPDEIYTAARSQFTEEQLIDLTMTAIGTGIYNRINIAFKTPAGDYQPGQFAVHENS